jgi:hypothetical protein
MDTPLRPLDINGEMGVFCVSFFFLLLCFVCVFLTKKKRKRDKDSFKIRRMRIERRISPWRSRLKTKSNNKNNAKSAECMKSKKRKGREKKKSINGYITYRYLRGRWKRRHELRFTNAVFAVFFFGDGFCFAYLFLFFCCFGGAPL